MKKILVVETSIPFSKSIIDCLSKDSFAVVCEPSAQKALCEISKICPDFVTISAALGEKELLHFIKGCKQFSATLPILVATDAQAIALQKLLYDNGADDVIYNPVAVEELALRIKAVLRRANQDTVAVRVVGETVFRRDTLTVSHSNGVVALSPREFSLLGKLVENPGKAFSRSELLDEFWDYSYPAHRSEVDTIIHTLRKKFADCSDFTIESVCEDGYKVLFS